MRKRFTDVMPERYSIAEARASPGGDRDKVEADRTRADEAAARPSSSRSANSSAFGADGVHSRRRTGRFSRSTGLPSSESMPLFHQLETGMPAGRFGCDAALSARYERGFRSGARFTNRDGVGNLNLARPRTDVRLLLEPPRLRRIARRLGGRHDPAHPLDPKLLRLFDLVERTTNYKPQTTNSSTTAVRESPDRSGRRRTDS